MSYYSKCVHCPLQRPWAVFNLLNRALRGVGRGTKLVKGRVMNW